MIDAVGHVAGAAGRCSTNTVKDIALSIIFIVLGLGFLAGGAYAIVEGWPYILIERGFTLVIVGTVLMTAGVVMLALSRVMAELRRVREQLSSAVMALSVASMANARDEREPGAGVTSGSPQAVDESGCTLVRRGWAVRSRQAAFWLPALPRSFSRDARSPRDTGRRTDTTAPGATGDTAREDDEPDLFAAPQTTEAPVAGAAEPFMPTLWPEPETDAARETHAESGPEPLPVATPDEFEAALTEATGKAEPRSCGGRAYQYARDDARDLAGKRGRRGFRPSSRQARARRRQGGQRRCGQGRSDMGRPCHADARG